MIQDIADALVQSWRNAATASVLFVPRLVAATIIFAAGFVVSLLARRAIRRLLAWLRFDRLSLRTGASEMLRLADMPTAEVLIAKVVFWMVWIGFIVSAVDTLHLRPVQGLVNEFFRFVPRFLVALLVLTLGFLVGNFLWRATLLASVNAGLPGARLLSGALRILVIAIGVVMALEQLGLATAVVLTAFAIMFGALMLGLAIAFGLGGREPLQAISKPALSIIRSARLGTRAPTARRKEAERAGESARFTALRGNHSHFMVKNPPALLATYDLLVALDPHGGLRGDFHVAPHADFVFERHERGVAFAREQSLVAVEQVFIDLRGEAGAF